MMSNLRAKGLILGFSLKKFQKQNCINKNAFRRESGETAPIVIFLDFVSFY